MTFDPPLDPGIENAVRALAAAGDVVMAHEKIGSVPPASPEPAEATRRSEAK